MTVVEVEVGVEAEVELAQWECRTVVGRQKQWLVSLAGCCSWEC